MVMSVKYTKKLIKIEKIIIWIATLYIWLAGVILIYWLILKILGYSPQTIDILIVMNSIILAAMLSGGLTVGIYLGKFNEVTKQFRALAKDFKIYMGKFDKLALDFKKYLKK